MDKYLEMLVVASPVIVVSAMLLVAALWLRRKRKHKP
ncbi:MULTISPECIES: LPXTG cell wall anchor domain-containing protein [Halomonadaceae]|nr:MULTISPECIES: LPXTG cell wall anchor domain-containing protein [Halomonas]